MGRKKKPLPLLEKVTIENIGAEGKALARVDNVVVFVKEAIPGDVADLQVFRKKGRYMEARVVKYHAFSDQRTEPFCGHFGVCGGCKWQHMSYKAQLKFKEDHVHENLKKLSGLKLPEPLPIIGSEKTTFYRNKLEFTFSNFRWLTKEEIDSGEEHVRSGVGFHIPGRFD